jgi:hypothetical protein
MGRMKEICIQIMGANDGQIPRDLTISDALRMEELQIYEWEEYEREQQKIRLQHLESENPGEAAKVAETEQMFRDFYNQTREEKEGSEQ